MSTLVAQTISNGTVSTSSANVIQGSAKAWVNFDGSSATINASYNVSSITNRGGNTYTVNFTNAFADTNYCVVFGYSSNSGDSVWPAAYIPRSPAKTTSAVGINLLVTAPEINLSVFR